MQSFTIPDPSVTPSDWTRKGRSYVIQTEALGEIFSDLYGRWLYEYSIIMPCAATDNKWVFLLNRNNDNTLTAANGEVVTIRTSDYPDSGWSDETVILANFNYGDSVDYPDNICDMIACRPIWDGSNWHVYVQAKPGTYSNQNSCPDATTINNIYEASGPSLAAGDLQWVRVSGTNHARAIISGSALPVGIGEELQAFNPVSYGLSNYPYMLSYQDWGCVDLHDCDHAPFNYISEDDSTYSYWYGPAETVYIQPGGDLGTALIFPDAILLGSLGAGRQGHPGIGFSASQLTDDPGTGYQYTAGIGFFDNPSNVPYTAPLSEPYYSQNAPNRGWPDPDESGLFLGALESTASDGNGPRMRSPRLVRNEYGYIVPQSYHGFPRTWVTYLYYSPSVSWNYMHPNYQPLRSAS